MQRKPLRFAATAVAIVIALAWNWLNPQVVLPDTGSTPQGLSVPADASGAQVLASLFQAERSGVMVEAAGRISRILPDDNKGSRHQRFIVRMDNGQTVLIAHNIDLAPRIAGLSEGRAIHFRGQYEWNERGGVVHWTHHDPNGRREGGWLRYDGREYR